MSDLTHKEFTKTPHFQRCCEHAEIEPTARQASKYRRKIGLAWAAHLALEEKAKRRRYS